MISHPFVWHAFSTSKRKPDPPRAFSPLGRPANLCSSKPPPLRPILLPCVLCYYNREPSGESIDLLYNRHATLAVGGGEGRFSFISSVMSQMMLGVRMVEYIYEAALEQTANARSTGTYVTRSTPHTPILATFVAGGLFV